jgi:hypothetical protein
MKIKNQHNWLLIGGLILTPDQLHWDGDISP